MTTVLKYATQDPVPTECVMDTAHRWTLVFGSETVRDVLQARTDCLRFSKPVGQHSIVGALQAQYSLDGGAFDPPAVSTFRADVFY